MRSPAACLPRTPRAAGKLSRTVDHVRTVGGTPVSPKRSMLSRPSLVERELGVDETAHRAGEELLHRRGAGMAYRGCGISRW